MAAAGCSMVADHIGNLAHLNARDTTLVFVSRAPQPEIERVKARMGWQMPWYSLTDSPPAFDADFGVDEWHGTNAFIHDGSQVFRTYFINNRGDEVAGHDVELPGHDRAGTPGERGKIRPRGTRRPRLTSGGIGTTNTASTSRHDGLANPTRTIPPTNDRGVLTK